MGAQTDYLPLIIAAMSAVAVLVVLQIRARRRILASLPKGATVPMHVGLRAKDLASNGQLEGALAVYQEFLEENPDSALALDTAGYYCLMLKRPSDAVRFLQRAVHVDPGYACAWCNLAEAKWMQRDMLGARDAFRAAMKCDPKDTLARIGLARLFMETKNPRGSCELLEEASRLQPKNAGVWMNLGIARSHLGDAARAREALENAVRLDPTLAEASKMLEVVRKTEAAAGLFAAAGGGPARGQEGLICAECGTRFIRSGKWARSNPAVGAVRCRSCQCVYCEPCVAKIARSRGAGNVMICACDKSKATLVETSGWRFDNFDEVVVYRGA